MARTKQLGKLKKEARELGIDEAVLDLFTGITDVAGLRALVASRKAAGSAGGAILCGPHSAAPEAEAQEAVLKEAAASRKRAAPDDQPEPQASSSAKAKATDDDDGRNNKNKSKKRKTAPRYYLKAFGGSKEINTFMLVTDSDTGQSEGCATKILWSDNNSVVVELLVWADEPLRMAYQCGIYELRQIQAMLNPRVGTLVKDYAEKLKRAVERHFGDWLRVEVCVV